MQFIRYINLFGRITNISARHCFSYNNSLIFVVPRHDILRAIGQNNSNLQKLSKVFLKRIRVVAQPKSNSQQEIKSFIETIIKPVEFTSIEIKGDEVVIIAGTEGKAMLIGRDRARQKELQNILDQYFNIKRLSIV